MMKRERGRQAGREGGRESWSSGDKNSEREKRREQRAASYLSEGAASGILTYYPFQKVHHIVDTFLKFTTKGGVGE